MTKELFVALREDGYKAILLKRIDESYLQKNFRGLIEYVINVTPDKLNSTPFDEEETAFAERWQKNYDLNKDAYDYLEDISNKKGKDYPIDLRDLASREKIRMGDQISLYSQDNHDNYIECPLDEIVNGYCDRIIQVVETPLPYEFINLVIGQYSID